MRSVPGLRDPLVTYRLTHRDRELLRSGLAPARAADARGRRRRGVPVVPRRAGGAQPAPTWPTMQRSLRRRRKASVMTVHLCSTVPMGEDSSACGADSFGRVHGTSNVWVNDASLLPTAPGVNPQATVMAFAIRNARHFVDEERPWLTRARRATAADDGRHRRRRLAGPGAGRTGCVADPPRSRVRVLRARPDRGARGDGRRSTRSSAARRIVIGDIARSPRGRRLFDGVGRRRRRDPHRRRHPPEADRRLLRGQHDRHREHGRGRRRSRRPPVRARVVEQPVRHQPARRPTRSAPTSRTTRTSATAGRRCRPSWPCSPPSRHGLDAIIVRPPWFYGPFQPPRQTTFFRMVRTGKFPVIGGGQPAAVDGVRRQPRRRRAARRARRRRLAAAATGSPTRGRTRSPRSSRPSAGRCADEGFTVKHGALRLPGDRRPRRRARRPADPAHRPLPAAAARARRDGHDHRLRHRASRATSSATSRRSSCTRACGAASAGASSRASSCDPLARHRRQRLLRLAARPPPASPPATTCACSTSTTPTTGPPTSSSCAATSATRDRGRTRGRRRRRRVPQRRPGAARQGRTSCCARSTSTAPTLLLDAARRAGVAQGRAHVVERGVRRARRRTRCCRPPCPSPAEAYGHAKLAAEWACLDAVAHGLDVTIVRPRTILGHGRLGHLRHPVRLDRRRRRRVRARRRRRTATSSSTPTTSPTCACSPRQRPGPMIVNAGTDRFGTMRESLESLCAPRRHRVAGALAARRPDVAGDAGRRRRCGLAPFAPYHWMMYSKSLWFDIEHARDGARLAAAVLERGDVRRQLRLVPRQPRDTTSRRRRTTGPREAGRTPPPQPRRELRLRRSSAARHAS